MEKLKKGEKIIGKVFDKDVIITPEFKKKIKEICPEMTDKELLNGLQKAVWTCAFCNAKRGEKHKDYCPEERIKKLEKEIEKIKQKYQLIQENSDEIKKDLKEIKSMVKELENFLTFKSKKKREQPYYIG